jgi:aclacinomycin oxidase
MSDQTGARTFAHDTTGQEGHQPGPDAVEADTMRPEPVGPGRADPAPAGQNAVNPGPAGPEAILPTDPRYDYLASRGVGYGRATGRPDRIHPVRSTDDVVAAVQWAVDDGLRLTVRSGGHCFEGFVDDPRVRVVIDTALMNDVSYDPAMGAFSVEAGARLGEVYRALYIGWGVVVPAGESPQVGAGGHILGGGYGFLSRLHGLAADHLHAVEVVVGKSEVDSDPEAGAQQSGDQAVDVRGDVLVAEAHHAQGRPLPRGGPVAAARRPGPASPAE